MNAMANVADCKTGSYPHPQPKPMPVFYYRAYLDDMQTYSLQFHKSLFILLVNCSDNNGELTVELILSGKAPCNYSVEKMLSPFYPHVFEKIFLVFGEQLCSYMYMQIRRCMLKLCLNDTISTSACVFAYNGLHINKFSTSSANRHDELL